MTLDQIDKLLNEVANLDQLLKIMQTLPEAGSMGQPAGDIVQGLARLLESSIEPLAEMANVMRAEIVKTFL